ncbi:MAG: nuclear transport factor 2 family protein [Rhizobacter sp.]|nr:nuclear transport factor 2 family protein [Chlorobiales bacterium]
MQTDSTDLIDRLVAAYNRCDARAFADCFEENVSVFEHPGTPAQQTREEIFQYYRQLFDQYPQNRTEILHRITIGNRIIDHERVRRHPESEAFEVLAIYDLGERLIKRLDFIRS